MEIKLNRKAFLAALERVSSATKGKTTVPILSHVLFEPDGDRLRLAATDLEIGIRSTVAHESQEKAAPFTLKADKLAEILKATDSEEIEIKSLDNDRFEIKAGRAKFKLYSMDPRSFPAMPASEGKPETVTLTISSKTLCEMIDKTIFAISPDQARYNLSGIYLESTEGGARITATDGHRLAMIEREAPGFACKGVIIPRNACLAIRDLIDGLDDSVTLHINNQLVSVTTNDTTITARLVEGEFPDCQGVIPSSSKVKISANRDELAGAIKRSLLMANERYSGVKFSLGDGNLTLSSTAPDVGEASETVEWTGTGIPDGKELAIGFNGKYIAQLLAALPEESQVTMSLSDEATAGMFTTDTDLNYQYVVMPMRL